MTLKERIFADYPIPFALSIWGGDGVNTIPLSNWEALLETSIDELGSDLYVTDYVKVSSNVAYLPKDTISVIGAGKLDFPFQGNRYVKVSYNRYNQTVNARYYPATVTIRRRLTLSNVDKLRGDFLIYLKHYMLFKMAEKELETLGIVDLNADNGTINLESLARFRDKHEERYIEMKNDIHIYSVSN